MTDEVPPAKPGAAEPASAAVPARPPAKKPRKAKETKVEPLLRAYFGTVELAPGAFLKAVAEVKASKFSDEDIAEAERLRRTRDLDHKRLLGLATQPVKQR